VIENVGHEALVQRVAAVFPLDVLKLLVLERRLRRYISANAAVERRMPRMNVPA
jgi:hypothetical protein